MQNPIQSNPLVLTKSNLARIKNAILETEEKIRHFEYEGEEINASKIERLCDRKDALILALASYESGDLSQRQIELLKNHS